MSNELLKDLIKDTNVEIIETNKGEIDLKYLKKMLPKLVKVINEATSCDFIKKPFIRVKDNNEIWIFIHDMPSCDDRPEDCWHLYKIFDLKTLKARFY